MPNGASRASTRAGESLVQAASEVAVGRAQVRSSSEGGSALPFREYVHLVHSDLYRLRGRSSRLLLLRLLLLGGSEGAFQYVFWMRTCAFAASQRPLGLPLFVVARAFLRRCSYRYGIDIPYTTSIGSGLYIGHSAASS